MWWKTKFRYNPENGGYTKKNFGYSALYVIGGKERKGEGKYE